MFVKEVIDDCVVFEFDYASAMVRNGKIISNVGFITPAERKKAIKTYYAITSKNNKNG